MVSSLILNCVFVEIQNINKYVIVNIEIYNTLIIVFLTEHTLMHGVTMPYNNPGLNESIKSPSSKWASIISEAVISTSSFARFAGFIAGQMPETENLVSFTRIFKFTKKV